MSAVGWMEDPGHAWLMVPVEEVRASGAEISVFSYERAGIAYLEEDCDAWAYAEAAKVSPALLADLSRVEGNPRGFATYSGAVA